MERQEIFGDIDYLSFIEKSDPELLELLATCRPGKGTMALRELNAANPTISPRGAFAGHSLTHASNGSVLFKALAAPWIERARKAIAAANAQVLPAAEKREQQAQEQAKEEARTATCTTTWTYTKDKPMPWKARPSTVQTHERIAAMLHALLNVGSFVIPEWLDEIGVKPDTRIEPVYDFDSFCREGELESVMNDPHQTWSTQSQILYRTIGTMLPTGIVSGNPSIYIHLQALVRLDSGSGPRWQWITLRASHAMRSLLLSHIASRHPEGFVEGMTDYWRIG